ncbi:MAG: chitobiase/beta-hexosaminidase C-terminal domain-containing protein [Lachnospiraceae bacterium]|nr:chitobiase/beta-hexosaminidase C-terminal domain-containing protein [Lachnospiraceae bacterium]
MERFCRNRRIRNIISRLLILALLFCEAAPGLRARAQEPEDGTELTAEDAGSEAEGEGELPSDEIEIPGADEAASSYRMTVRYEQSSARAAADLINKQRTGEGGVSGLVYDYRLEEQAMLRAAEVAVCFSDKRPNGQSFTSVFSKNVLDARVQELRFLGGSSAPDAVSKWLETKKEEIFKREFRYVGIGHVVLGGVHYWVVEYTSVVQRMEQTDQPDGDRKLSISILDELITDRSISPSLPNNSTINIEYNKEVKLPTFGANITVTGHEPAGTKVPLEVTEMNWILEDPNFAVIKNGNIRALVQRGDSKARAIVFAGLWPQTFYYKLHVLVYPTSISLSTNTLELQVDDTYQLGWTVLPEDADSTAVVFHREPADSKITVSDKGLITAGAAGKAVITIETVDGGCKDSCTVTVSMNIAVQMPKLEPEEGMYHKDQFLSLRTETPDALIRYTLDGSDPTPETGTIYSDPFRLPGNCVLKALAYKELKLDDGSKQVVASNVLVKQVYLLADDWGEVAFEDRDQWGSSDLVPDGLWIAKASMPECIYNGKPHKPAGFRVYYGTDRLEKGKEYTISYKNNTDVGTEGRSPQAIFSFKGSLSGKNLSRDFTILPLSLDETEITVPGAVCTGSVIKPEAKVSWNGKTLKAGIDYELSCDREINGAGDYVVTVRGIGNFTGTKEYELTVSDGSGKLDLTKAKVSPIPDQPFLEEGYSDVSQLKDKKGNTLVLKVTVGKETLGSTDYACEIRNGDEAGTATLRIEAAGSRTVGFKEVNFTISGEKLDSAIKIDKIPDQGFTGSAIEPHVVARTKDGILPESAYELSYSKNINAGTARVTVTARADSGYSGSVSKTFRIKKVKLADAAAENLLQVIYDEQTEYEQGKVLPANLRICYRSEDGLYILEEGKDYKLVTKNNKAVADKETAGKNAPSFCISGKGNFSGKTGAYYYSICPKSLSGLEARVPDAEYKEKAGAYKVKPVVIDKNGKKLKLGKDLDPERFVYRYLENCSVKRGSDANYPVKAGEEVGADDILPIGTALQIAIFAKEGGNYSGVIRINYKVVGASKELSAAKAKIADQVYTGSEIFLTKDQIRLTINGSEVPKDCFEIVSCSNNRNAGTAKVLLKGKNGYGGSKEFSFKIVKKDAGTWQAGTVIGE